MQKNQVKPIASFIISYLRLVYFSTIQRSTYDWTIIEPKTVQNQFYENAPIMCNFYDIRVDKWRLCMCATKYFNFMFNSLRHSQAGVLRNETVFIKNSKA